MESLHAPMEVRVKKDKGATKVIEKQDVWVLRGPGFCRMGIGGNETKYWYSEALGITVPLAP